MEERRDDKEQRNKEQRSRSGRSGKRVKSGKRTKTKKGIRSEKKISSGNGVKTEKNIRSEKSNSSGIDIKTEKDIRSEKSDSSGKGTKFGNGTILEKGIDFIQDIGRRLSDLWNKAAERIPRPALIGGLIIAAVLIGIVFFLGRGNSVEETEVSAGQKDNIKGFMFIFDKRSVQQRLVVDMKEGRVPLKLTCEKIDLVPNDDGTVTEVVDAGATVVSEDSDFIKQVYQEMTDMIVIGQIPMRDNTTRCRITLVLQDGTDCIFTFDTVSIIEIEGQDYMMESDGGLWKLLPGFF